MVGPQANSAGPNRFLERELGDRTAMLRSLDASSQSRSFMESASQSRTNTSPGEAWEEFITEAVYPEPQSKARDDYRNYDKPARETVREFYRENHREGRVRAQRGYTGG
jgi:hypothetical protein